MPGHQVIQMLDKGVPASSATDLPGAALPADAAVLERGGGRAAHLRDPLRAAGDLLRDRVLFLRPHPGRGEMKARAGAEGQTLAEVAEGEAAKSA